MTARAAWPVDCREVRAGHGTRDGAELHSDLIAGCTLGQLSHLWNESGHLPRTDLADLDRIAAGLYSTLIALRAGGGE